MQEVVTVTQLCLKGESHTLETAVSHPKIYVIII